MKRPSFQFYPADWRKDPALSTCSLAARGLWIEMMCLAHESERYGVLSINGTPMSVQQIARAVGESPSVIARLVTELERSSVFSRDAQGCILSRRMVRDERIRNVRADAGRLGGNPHLVERLVNQKDKQTSEAPETERDVFKDFSEKIPKKSSKKAAQCAVDSAPLCFVAKDTQPIDFARMGSPAHPAQGQELVANLVKQNGNQSLTPSSSSSSSSTTPNLNPKPRRADALQVLLTPLIEGLDAEAWAEFVTFRSAIRKPINQASAKAAQTRLVKFGSEAPGGQLAVVRQSIANGWQGLFALKQETSYATHQRMDNSAVGRVERATAHLYQPEPLDGASHSGSVAPDGQNLRPPLDVSVRGKR